MKDEFRRLLEDKSQAPLRAVLESSRRDKPSQQALMQASRALGISAASLGAARSVAAAEAARALHTSLWVGLAKWGAAGLLLGGLALSPFVSPPPPPQPVKVRPQNAPQVLAGLATSATTVAAPEQVQAPSVVGSSTPVGAATTVALRLPEAIPARTSAPPAPPAPPAPRAAPTAAPEPPVGSFPLQPTPSAPVSPPRPDFLDTEVALIDAVRTALQRDDPNAALAWLDRHDRLKTPSLDAEALLLRVQALVAAGRAPEARAVARAALAGTSTPAYAPRLRKLAGLPE
jgi:hypothetical protein